MIAITQEPKRSEEELFIEVTRLFDLKKTEFIVEPGLESSYCDTYTKDGITIDAMKNFVDNYYHGLFEKEKCLYSAAL